MLLNAPDPGLLVGIRDRAVLELLYSTGLRRAEIVALDLTDVDLTDCIVIVRSGKGGKDRIVPLGETAAEALVNYLTKARSMFLKHPGVTALLLGRRNGRHPGGQRLGPGSILDIVKRAALRSEIGKRITPHMFRHSFATHLLRAGADLRHVQEMLGHNRIDTTETYTHLDVTDLSAAHAKAHPRGKERR
jgi:site-specific recombinase XerD